MRLPDLPHWHRLGNERERLMWLRYVVLFMFMASAACFVAYVFTGNKSYRRVGLEIFKWTVLAGLVFFGVLAVQSQL